MKSLKNCIIESLLDDEDEVFDGAKEDIIKEFLETNYKINGSYTVKETKEGFIVDVKGSASVKNKNITSLTNGLFEFGSISGDFYCSDCKSLKSLEYAPKEVGSGFYCDHCESLTSLKGAPKEVKDFDCSCCDSLKSLEGAPKEVRLGFRCNGCNSLKTLEGAPQKVDHFICKENPNLIDVKDAPKKCDMFNCENCVSLKDLSGVKTVYIHCMGCGKNFNGKYLVSTTGAKYKVGLTGRETSLQ